MGGKRRLYQVAAVPLLHRLGVETMHDDLAAKRLAEPGSPADVIDVAVGEADGRELGRVKAEPFDVEDDLVVARPCAGVYHDELA
jgi:hypothetical protein